MSEDSPTPPPVDLSGLQIMPSWVSNLGKAEPSWEDHPAARAEEHRGPGGPRGRRQDGGGAPRHDQRGRDDRGGGGRGPGFAGRRDERGGRGASGAGQGQGGQRQGGGYREGGHRGQDRRDQHPRPAPLPEGISAHPEPEEKALDALVAHVRATKHAFSVFDAAKLLLGDGSRFKVKITAEEGKATLWRVPADGSVWLTRDEAISHILGGAVLEKFYRPVEVEREAPRGVFQSVAVCGFSGELLGPPNHHSFQTAVSRVHREKYPQLPLEVYRRRIRTEHDPALVEKWLESQRKAIEWVWIKDPSVPKPPPETAKPVAEVVAPPEPVTVDEPAESVPEEAATADIESPAETETADASEAPMEAASEEASAEAASGDEPGDEPQAPLPTGLVLKSRLEMEAHFRAHHADRAVKEAKHAYVPGNPASDSLNPDLLRVVRICIDIARSRPFAMTQKVCGSFERKGLKIFKRRGGKLFVSTARPKALDPTTPLSDGIRKLVEVVRATPGITVPRLLAKIAPLPEGTDMTPERRQAMQDLHWLADSGYLIEFSDGMVTLGVQGEAKESKEKGKAETGRESEETPEPAPEPEPEPERASESEPQSEIERTDGTDRSDRTDGNGPPTPESSPLES